MKSNERDLIHEQLCAWILGEASAEEARQVQEALAKSPELRAERERLVQTIGLVGSALGAQEQLSQKALTELIGVATPGPSRPEAAPRWTPTPWYASPMVKLAAAITVILGGTLGILASRGAFIPNDLETAATDASRPMAVEAPTYIGTAGALEKRREVVAGKRAAGAPEQDGAANRLEALSALGYLAEGKTSEKEQTAGETEPRETARRLGSRGYARETRTRLPHDETGSGEERQNEEGAVVGGIPIPDPVGVSVEAKRVLPTFEGSTGQTRLHYAAENAVSPPAELSGVQDLGTVVDRSEVADELTLQGNLIGIHDKTAKTETLWYENPVLDPAGPQPAGATTVLGRRVAPVPGGGGGAPGRLAERGRTGPASPGSGEYGTRVGDSVSAESGRVPLGEPQLGELADRLAHQQCTALRRRPGERPRDMFFRFWGDNAFTMVAEDPQSTFAADVDTASYTLARGYLNEGFLPTKDQVRTEEFLNYPKPDLPAPTEAALAIHTEVATSLFGGGSRERVMLRVGLRGKEIAQSARKPLRLTFVVDTSGSMQEGGRLDLVKHAMRLLLAQLGSDDRVGIVAYSNEARLVLPLTPADQRDLVESALHPLSPSGGTNAEAGLKMGYELAMTGLDASAHNRVILLSDGVANIGQTDQDRINADVARQRSAGIYLNTIGVGMNNHNDVFLEQLANKGDGVCDYVDSPEAARRAIVERFTGALIPIASDVKVQVEFNPTRVVQYRLLGYENRAIADQDFRNDAVDAGEVGSGHQVVALYELDLRTLDPTAETSMKGPLATVRARWKAPKVALQHPLEVEVTEVEALVTPSDVEVAFSETSVGYRRSVLLAQFAEFLRRSTHARGDSFMALDGEISKLVAATGDAEASELQQLVRRAIQLGLPTRLIESTPLQAVLDEYKRHLHLRAQLEEMQELRKGLRGPELDRLRQQNDDLEKRIREMIFQDLRSRNG